jgi:hypothetical protein
MRGQIKRKIGFPGIGGISAEMDRKKLLQNCECDSGL